MPVGGKSQEEEHGKDKQVWSPSVGTTNPLSRVLYQTIQYSHRRPGWVFKGRELSASRSCGRGE